MKILVQRVYLGSMRQAQQTAPQSGNHETEHGIDWRSMAVDYLIAADGCWPVADLHPMDYAVAQLGRELSNEEIESYRRAMSGRRQ